MVHPRVALASGAAAAGGAAILLSGRLDGSALVALVLILAARAAAAGATQAPEAARALARQVASVPAWSGVLAVGVLRAGSVRLADVRGANAVAGLAVARGGVALVAACWLACCAALLATLSPARGSGPLAGIVLPSSPYRRLDAFAVGLQVVLALTLFAGPQVRDARDAAAWIVGALVSGLALWAGRLVASWDWVPKAATAASFGALALALAGGRL